MYDEFDTESYHLITNNVTIKDPLILEILIFEGLRHIVSAKVGLTQHQVSLTRVA